MCGLVVTQLQEIKNIAKKKSVHHLRHSHFWFRSAQETRNWILNYLIYWFVGKYANMAGLAMKGRQQACLVCRRSWV